MGDAQGMNMWELYRQVALAELQRTLGLSSPMAVPRVLKATLNMGVGEGASDKAALESACRDLALISGQKAVITKARKSIAGFRIRAGWPIGCKVTLRGRRMYDFLHRLVHVAIPRIRDFRGLSPKSFDGHGNFSIGIDEQIVFPEIAYDRIDKLRGLDITVTTSARDDAQGAALLRALGFPLAAGAPAA